MKRTELKRKTPLAAKSAKPKAKKGHTRGWYSKRLDLLAKGFAKERDGYFCQYSGDKVEGSNAHGSHVIPVSAGLALRWDLRNIKCLAYHWHLNWWHKNPIESAEWFKLKFQVRWEYLQAQRLKPPRKLLTYELIEFYEAAKQCETWEEYAQLYDCSIGRG